MNKYILILAITFLILPKSVFCRSNCSMRVEASEPIVIKRQFARVESQPITITIEEIKIAYGFGTKIINNYSNLGASQPINIGIANKTSAQEWSIKNQTFQNNDTVEVVGMNTTGYAANFPNSEFALKRKNKSCTNCDEYQFANFQGEGIYYDGRVEFDRSRNKLYVDTLNYILSNLPATIDFDININDTLDIEDDSVFIQATEKRVGYGTLIASDGSSHQVLKTVQSYNKRINNISKSYKTVEFVSDDGYRLTLRLTDTASASGVVNVNYIDEYILKSNTTNIKTSEIALKNKLTCYPNPVSTIINIEGLISGRVYIINNMGVKVKEIESNGLSLHPIDVSDLANGIYTLLSGSQNIKFRKND